MTPCNHTFCRECIERAVGLTKKDSSIPCNQCPICKGKTPKRSLNPSSAAAKLCKIYEEIVITYSEILGGNGDWIYESGIRGNDDHYAGYGGVPLDNLSQLYPYPEKPGSRDSSESSDFLTELEEEETGDTDTQMMNESSRIYDETTQLLEPSNNIPSFIPPDSAALQPPSSQLIFEETQQLTCCDRLMINTQELEKLAAINDSIDRELAELEEKLAATREETEEDVAGVNITGTRPEKGSKLDAALKENRSDALMEDELEKSEKNKPDITQKNKVDSTQVQVKKTKTRIIQSSESKTRPVPVPTNKKTKTEKSIGSVVVVPACDDATFDPTTVAQPSTKITGITTTGIKDEKSQIQLASFSEKFNFPVFPDFQGCPSETTVSHLLIPTTGRPLIVKKRTMKYFEGILLQKEIISFDWVAACLKAGKLLPSNSFKIQGDEIGIKQQQQQQATPASHPKHSDKIFSNHKFYLYGDFRQPPRDQLEGLILATKSPLLASVQELSRGAVILADPSAQFTFEKDAQIIKKYPIVGTGWFLDSISCGRALEFHGYFIL